MCRAKRGEALETASQEVLDHTEETWKNHVRLYFRPRTPTQYQVEGFRPKGQLGSLQAHMPVPVFFLFDAKDILTRASTKFSNGNLAAHPVVGENADYFEAIPFEKVYHDSWMSEGEKANIKFHRHAEVVVPDELDLDALQLVWLRTEAEYKTLLQLLPVGGGEEIWAEVPPRKEAQSPFLQLVFCGKRQLGAEQNLFSLQCQHADARPICGSSGSSQSRDRGGLQVGECTVPSESTLTVGIPQIKKAAAFDVRFTLDGAVAYADRFTPKTISF